MPATHRQRSLPLAIALLALLCLPCPEAEAKKRPDKVHGNLRQRVDADGTIVLSGGGRASGELSGGSDAPEMTLRSWTDKSGVVHLISAPTRRAVELARREQVTPSATGKQTRVRDIAAYDAAISQAASRYSIPHALVRAVIVAESNFNPDAVSPAGAVGLMQIMPDTARLLSVSDRRDPLQSIEGGTRYLRILANQFDGDLVRTIAAYNAGPGAVRKYDGIPPFKETRGYVKRVMSLYKIYSDRKA